MYAPGGCEAGRTAAPLEQDRLLREPRAAREIREACEVRERELVGQIARCLEFRVPDPCFLEPRLSEPRLGEGSYAANPPGEQLRGDASAERHRLNLPATGMPCRTGETASTASRRGSSLHAKHPSVSEDEAEQAGALRALQDLGRRAVGGRDSEVTRGGAGLRRASRDPQASLDFALHAERAARVELEERLRQEQAERLAAQEKVRQLEAALQAAHATMERQEDDFRELSQSVQFVQALLAQEDAGHARLGSKHHLLASPTGQPAAARRPHRSVCFAEDSTDCSRSDASYPSRASS